MKRSPPEDHRPLPLFWMAPVTGYLDGYPHQDAGPAYQDYLLLLTLLRAGQGRLVLKDPFHALNLPALFSVLPDAFVVQTQREPAEVVPSIHKLALTTQAVFSEKLGHPSIVEASTRWLQTVAERSVAARVAADVLQDRVLDVPYRELLADPVGTARLVHQRAGLPWSEGTEERIRSFVWENGQRRYGENPYDAEGLGQTKAGIEGKFDGYRGRFLAA